MKRASSHLAAVALTVIVLSLASPLMVTAQPPESSSGDTAEMISAEIGKAFSSQQTRPRLAIMPIACAADNTGLATDLAEDLSLKLTQGGRVRLVEDALRQTLIEEIKYQNDSGLFDVQSCKQYGKQSGVEYMLFLRIYRTESPVVTWRLIHLETQVVKLAGASSTADYGPEFKQMVDSVDSWLGQRSGAPARVALLKLCYLESRSAEVKEIQGRLDGQASSSHTEDEESKTPQPFTVYSETKGLGRRDLQFELLSCDLSRRNLLRLIDRSAVQELISAAGPASVVDSYGTEHSSFDPASLAELGKMQGVEYLLIVWREGRPVRKPGGVLLGLLIDTATSRIVWSHLMADPDSGVTDLQAVCERDIKRIYNELTVHGNVAVAPVDNSSLWEANGGFVRDIITHAALRAGAVILSREALDAVIQEQKMGHSGMLDPETCSKLGSTLQARYILIPTITDEDVWPAGPHRQMVLSLLLVDTTSAVVTKSTCSYVDPEAKDSLLRTASIQALDDLRKYITDVATIVAVNNAEVRGTQYLGSDEVNARLQAEATSHLPHRVVARQQMGELLEELKLGISGVADQSDALQTGKWEGFDALLMPSAKHAAQITDGKILQTLTLTVKLVSLETGETLAVGRGEATSLDAVPAGFRLCSVRSPGRSVSDDVTGTVVAISDHVTTVAEYCQMDLDLHGYYGREYLLCSKAGIPDHGFLIQLDGTSNEAIGDPSKCDGPVVLLSDGVEKYLRWRGLHLPTGYQWEAIISSLNRDELDSYCKLLGSTFSYPLLLGPELERTSLCGEYIDSGDGMEYVSTPGYDYDSGFTLAGKNWGNKSKRSQEFCAYVFRGVR